MGLFEFILGMTLICTIGGIITTGLQVEKRKVKAKVLLAENEDLRSLIADLHGELKAVKDRVRVLERLATDGDRNLASEIERLRRHDSSAGL